MIESLIIDRLLGDVAIQAYVGKKVYISSAPEGTTTPYIVVSVEDGLDDLAIATFDVVINIYDVNEDKRPQREASKTVHQLLNYTLLGGDGYSSVRLFFRGRSLVREDESTLSRVLMTFDGRGCDDNNVNNLINP